MQRECGSGSEMASDQETEERQENFKLTRHRGHHFRLLVKPLFPEELLPEIHKIHDEPSCQPTGGSTHLHLVG